MTKVIEGYSINTSVIAGEGMQGTVVVAEHVASKRQVVAKITKLDSKIQKDRFLSENILLAETQGCKGVVKLENYFIDGPYGISILEKMPYDLMTLIEKDMLTVPQRMNVFKLVCNAVKELHDKRVVHLDIKPENILVSSDFLSIKLCDFGNAQSLPPSGLVTTSCGTILYSAPENYSGNPFDGKKADIWSLGILYHVLISYHWPYEIHSEMDLRTKVETGALSYQVFLNDTEKVLMEKMVAISSVDRVDIVTLCSLLNDRRRSTLKPRKIISRIFQSAGLRRSH